MTNNLKGKLRLSQIMIILYFICHGSLLGSTTNLIYALSCEDGWMVPIISTIIGFIPFYITISIMNKYPNKNIFQIIEIQFGKIFGKFINFVLVLFVCSYTAIFFWDLTNFISSQYLYNTSQTFIAILFVIPMIYLLSKGIEVIFRSSIIIFMLSFLFFVISELALIPQIQISNIFPILQDGISSPLKSLFGTVAYLILPTFMITCIPKDNYESNQKFTKNMIIAYFLTQLAISLILFAILGVFGIELTKLYQYPEFQILRRVSIGGFIERVESTLSIYWILDLFMMITFACYFIKTGIVTTFKIKNKKLYKYIINTFICLVTLTSLFIFSSNTSANSFLMKIYPIFCFVFFLGIPVITYLFSLIKKKH